MRTDLNKTKQTMITVKGRLMNILGQNVVITQGPTYPVVQFITNDQFDKYSRSLESKFVVRETLITLDGSKIIVNYIKKFDTALYPRKQS